MNIQVETDAHTHMKNGKKICWNYRKGRCRFGSNCTYAHDSDLHVTEPVANDNEITHSTIGHHNQNHQQQHHKVSKTSSTGTAFTTKTNNNKKRSGLGDSIVPSKKVIKAYNALKK